MLKNLKGSPFQSFRHRETLEKLCDFKRFPLQFSRMFHDRIVEKSDGVPRFSAPGVRACGPQRAESVQRLVFLVL